MSASPRLQVPIAVVGVSALFPGSTDAQGFWNDILAGKDLITDVPPSHWLIDDYYDPDPKAVDKTYARRGGFLPVVDFDPLEFGVPPSIVPATDSAQILALIVAQQVLDDAAQGQFAKMNRDRISVVLGVTSAQELLGEMTSRLQKPIWLKALRESGIPEAEAQQICTRIADSYTPWQESTFPGLLGNVVAGRIANRFDLRGTNAVTDAACASSLAAVAMGINELQLGQSDLVITGGVDAMNDIFMYMCFSKTPALSPTGDCRPFADDADGTMLGEGLAMLALKRLDDAERDGDRVYAVIRGLGTASDGRANSVYAPLPEGQARALRRAYEVAGYGPETVELVEAHGTGTKAGDVAEFAGLKLAFDTGRADHQWCALGSVKSQIGHTKAAAGAAGLFKAVMALHHKVLPPTIKVGRPNPKLDIEHSPFYLNTQRRPWIRDNAHPRRAAVSSFGFGGSNFHVTLEEYVPATASGKRAWRLRSAPTELVLLSAASSAQLIEKCHALAAAGRTLAHLARDTQTRFQASDTARLALVASSSDDLHSKLKQAAQTIEQSPAAAYQTPTGIHYACGTPAHGQIAFLFPGQGSQYPGMGAELAMSVDVARQPWDEAANLRFGGERLHEVVFPKPAFTADDRDAQAKKLTATEWAQPALGVHSQGLTALLRSLGVQPDCVAGHSFGEVSALHAAGVLDAAQLLKVARRRGELMRDASAVAGAMTAVSAPLEAVRSVVTASGAPVVIANHNSPNQVVLSGAVEAIASVEAALAAQGMAVKRLPVATAFHSPLVAGSSVPFAEFLHGVPLQAPHCDVFSNATAAIYPAQPDAIREQLAAQLAQPVRFVEMIEAMYARGVRTFVEVGAGSVLTELVGRILGERAHHAINLDRKGKHGVSSLQEGLGRLALAGVPINFAPLWADIAPPSNQEKRKPAMTLPINGTNPGRPYPPAGGTAELPPPNPPRPPIDVPAAQVPKVGTGGTAIDEPAAPATPQLAPMTYIPPQATQQATPMATPIATPAMNTDTQLAWVQAFQETQRQTAEAHAAYQRAMADSHMAFLRTAEVSFAGLSALLGASPAAVLNPASAPAAPVSGEPAQSVVAAPAVASVSALAAPAANAPQRPITQHQAPQVLVPPTPSVAAPIPTLALTQAVPSAVDLDSLMMGIVAEKTGYPPEMLNPAMELEADLGIDSIKRVEILAALRERAPHLPEIKASDLALLRTLGQIIGHLRSTLDSFANAASAGSQAATATIVGQPTPNAGDPALDALLLGVVAEKTGYPPQMLNLDMELEADLGIDSIKRVEILSSLRERAPALPELKASDLAVLRTLGQIVRHLQAAAGVSAIHQAASPPGGTTALASGLLNVPAKRNEPDTPDLATLLLDIVAEKTGYPQGMLNLQMALEADLGIDSIKRVEILAALRERAPNLPELKATDLAVLRTLGQIVEHMTTAVTPASLVEKTPAPVAPATSARIERYALREAATPASGQPMPGLRTAKRLVLTDDATGVADALQVLLAQQGIKANTVATIPADADGVIFLGGLRKVATVEDALAVNREAFHAARAVAALMAVHGGVFVTVQDTGGDFGLSGACAPQRAYLGGVSALTRTAALEWPQAAVKAIDIARGNPRTKKAADAQTTAVAIAHELLHGGDSLEVGLHADGRRTTLVAEASASPLVAVGNISADSVLVASGGARGVTAAALIALAKAKQPRMVLLGRSELSDEADELHGVVDEVALKSVLLKRAQVAGQSPTPAMLNAALADVLAQREIRSTLAALKAAGSEARYLALDVTDEAALTRALKDVRKQWGPITAVVHGAGVLADKRIEDKSDAQFDRVFDTKVKGLRALLAATAKDPLSALCLFSSVAARSGNPGQCDYAMANEVLNLVACAERTRRGEACVVRSIGWGPWEGGMVTPSLKTHFEQMGVPLLPLEVGARHFVAEITGRSDEVSIVIGGTQRGGILQANTEPRATIASAGHRPNAEAAALA